MNIVKSSKTLTTALLTGTLAIAASPAQAEDWEWTIAPYVWASDVGIDMYVNDNAIVGADIGFDDILDKTDFASQMHIEGMRGRAGFFIDFTFLNLGSSQTTGARPPLPGGTQIHTDLKTTVFEAAGVYRLSGDETGLDLIFGARLLDMDVTVDFALPPPLTGTTQVEASETMTDGFVGLRYSAPFAERWAFIGRGDVGAGDSDLTWNASAYLAYAVGERRKNMIMMGYRHLVIEYKSTLSGGASAETDLTMSGPAVGFAFRF